jgi:oligopeptide transport system ATP-binding protein
VACHFYETLPSPAEGVAAAGGSGKFALRLAAYEAARKAGP